MSFTRFHPVVRQWFTTTLGEPTAARRCADGSPSSTAGTRSSPLPPDREKPSRRSSTALDELTREGLTSPLPDEVRVLYVSPLKALSADIHKNLAEPRRGFERIADEQGLAPPRITAAVRTGDTTQGERAAMIRTPPHILVTTPESLYLLLTSERSRHMLRTVRTVIVDEIHAVIGTRRGAHLALSLERLQHVCERPLLRIGLSATQKPIDEVGRYLVGASGEACTIVDTGHRRDDGSRHRDPGRAARSGDGARSLGGVPRPARGAHHGASDDARLREHAADGRTPGPSPERTARRRRRSRRITEASRKRRASTPRRGSRRAGCAPSSRPPRSSSGIDIGHVDLVCQIGSPHRIATLLQRVGRSGHTIARPPQGTRLSDFARRPRRVRGAAAIGAGGATSMRSSPTTRRSTCWRSRWSPRRRAPSTAKTTSLRSCEARGLTAICTRAAVRRRPQHVVGWILDQTRPARRAPPPRRGQRDPARAGAAAGCWRRHPAAPFPRSPTSASSSTRKRRSSAR